MKKFFVFTIFLLLLIISEYFLINEIFSQKRIGVLIPSLLGTVIFLFVVIRFFKKYILPVKQ